MRVLYWILLLLLVVLVFWCVVCWWVGLEDPYQLLASWDSIISHYCEAQDQQLRLGDTHLEDPTSSRGPGRTLRSVVPSYCPALESPLPNVRKLESLIRENHDTILAESLALMAANGGVPMVEIDLTQSKFIGETGWRPMWVKFLDGYASTADRLPTLKRIAESVPGLNLLHVSVMRPGTVLMPHRGPTRAVYRYHYGLVIPEGNTGLYLSGHRIHWKEREGFTWDDTLIHGAWNKTDKPRLVIFADVRRDLGPLLNLGTSLVFWAVSRTSTTRAAAAKLEGYLREHLDVQTPSPQIRRPLPNVGQTRQVEEGTRYTQVTDERPLRRDHNVGERDHHPRLPPSDTPPTPQRGPRYYRGRPRL